jgi:hypothetical protein
LGRRLNPRAVRQQALEILPQPGSASTEGSSRVVAHESNSPQTDEAREYRELAETARKRAAATSVRETRERFLAMAENWEKLAMEIERQTKTKTDGI